MAVNGVISRSVPRPVQYAGQALAYAAFFLLVAYLSYNPHHQVLAPGKAVVILSLTHSGKPVGECRVRSQEELAQMSPNMREPLVCPRERLPIYVELEINGSGKFHEQAEPSGLRKDGLASVYGRYEVAAGHYRVVVRMRDSARAEGYDYEQAREVDLSEGRILVVDFDRDNQRFLFR